MDTALLVVRLLLAGVFAVAGMAKLADRVGFRKTLADFGVPTSFTAPLATVMPLTELVVAGMLLVRRTAWWGGVGASTLLLLFTGAIAVNLARGRRPDCNCFGHLGSAPIGWSTVIRNAVFASAAALVVVRGPSGAGPGLGDWLAARSAGQVLALGGATVGLVALAAVAWALAHLVRQQGRLLLRIEELEAAWASSGHAAAPHSHGAHAHGPHAAPAGRAVGEAAPPLSLPDLDGNPVDLAGFRGRRTLVLFWNPDCGFCQQMLPALKAWEAEPAPDVPQLLVVSGGSVPANREMGLRSTVVLDDSFAVGEAFGVGGTPTAVLLDADLSIASDLVAGGDAVMALINRHGTADPKREPVPVPA